MKFVPAHTPSAEIVLVETSEALPEGRSVSVAACSVCGAEMPDVADVGDGPPAPLASAACPPGGPVPEARLPGRPDGRVFRDSAALVCEGRGR